MNLKPEDMPLGISLPDQQFNRAFDFSQLAQAPVSIQLDVGASAYWSEIATQQTLDNLLVQDKIDLVTTWSAFPTAISPKNRS